MEIFGYTFMQRALLAGIFVGVSCAGLGVFLVLRRFAMIGDGLAHVGFAAVALGLLSGLSPIAIAVPLVMAASLGILKLGEKTTLYGDTAIALVAALAVACGILLASISSGFNIDLFSYLFGSILAISGMEVILSVVLSIIVGIVLVLFYHDLFAITYDEDYAKVSGVKTDSINQVLILLTALTVTLGIRVVGTLLVSSLIIFPAVTALQISRGFRSTIVIAIVCSIISIILGILVSFFLNLPTGATIVIINFVLFLISLLYSRVIKRAAP